MDHPKSNRGRPRVSSQQSIQGQSASPVRRHSPKNLHITSYQDLKDQVSDVQVWGDPDMVKLLCKASSEKEGWMKSLKAVEIPHVGCVLLNSTQQRNPDGSYVLAEASTFVPGTKILDQMGAEGAVVSRQLVHSV